RVGRMPLREFFHGQRYDGGSPKRPRRGRLRRGRSAGSLDGPWRPGSVDLLALLELFDQALEVLLVPLVGRLTDGDLQVLDRVLGAPGGGVAAAEADLDRPGARVALRVRLEDLEREVDFLVGQELAAGGMEVERRGGGRGEGLRPGLL